MTISRLLLHNSFFERLKSSTTTRHVLAYFAVPITVGLIFIIRVFLINDCYAFENNDEVAHTFVDINLAWKMLREGSIPFMNLYNNFGTPMIGDPVTNPFALHSLSYLVFSPHIAATINRFLMISATVSLLTFFLHKHFSVSLSVSSFCAILVALLPNLTHFSVLHPHQGALAYFLLILIMQRRLRANITFVSLLGLYLSLLLFSFSVGTVGIVFAVPYLILSQYIDSQFRFDKPFNLFALLMIAALAFRLPHFAYFYEVMSVTARSSLNYAGLVPYAPMRLFSVLLQFTPQGEFGMHVSRCIYYSLPLIALCLIGVRYASNRQRLYAIVLLGLAPLAFVTLLLAFGGLRDFFPVLKPLDVVRILWFSNVYVAAGVASTLDAMRRRRASFPIAVIVRFLLGFSFYSFCSYVSSTHGTFQAVSALTITGGLLLVLVVRSLQINRRFARGTFTFALAALFVSFLPLLDYTIDVFNTVSQLLSGVPLTRTSYFFHAESESQFHPKRFLQMMAPSSRVTAHYDPLEKGYLTHIAKAQLFGSDGRSIMLHRGLRNSLLRKGLVTVGGLRLTYYFTAHDLDKLSRLGIRYVITSEPDDLDSLGWQLIGIEPNEPSYLYENPRDVDIAYLVDGSQINYLHDISYSNNKVHISLSRATIETESDLVATFVRWPGWKVLIDGKPANIEASSDYLLRVRVRPEDKAVTFYFEPFTAFQIIMCMIGSVGVVLITPVVLAVLERRRVTH